AVAEFDFHWRLGIPLTALRFGVEIRLHSFWSPGADHGHASRILRKRSRVRGTRQTHQKRSASEIAARSSGSVVPLGRRDAAREWADQRRRPVGRLAGTGPI